MVKCAYCSYDNRLISYLKEIVARTEQYCCPIKHARRVLASQFRARPWKFRGLFHYDLCL